jgi:hypothetical protein
MSSQDQKLMIPLITRNEFIYKTLNPDAADNPYDSVLRYDTNLGAELPMASRPCLPDHLCCSICKELCMQAVKLSCCNSQVLTSSVQSVIKPDEYTFLINSTYILIATNLTVTLLFLSNPYFSLSASNLPV